MNDIFPSRDIQLLIYMKTIIEEFCFQFYWNYKHTKTEATEVCKSLKTILPFAQELHLKILKNCLQSTPMRQHFQLQSKTLYVCSFWFSSFKTVQKSSSVEWECNLSMSLSRLLQESSNLSQYIDSEAAIRYSELQLY